MTSIHNNAGAISALQTLRSIGSGMAAAQGQVSSGLRIQTASDNAAYWSISTTMRSDNAAVSAVADALGFAAAKADTAYTGLDAVIDILGEFKAKLVLAKEPGVDKAKVQKELAELQQQVQGISQAASFSGANWLNTDISNIYDFDRNKASSVSAFVRDASGAVAVRAMDLHLSAVSLFNSTGGGLLQTDARDLDTLGGIRGFSSSNLIGGDLTQYDGVYGSGWMYPKAGAGGAAIFGLNDFPDGSSLDFTAPGAQISFDIILDKEASNPGSQAGTSGELQDLPGPYYAGYTKSITITKAQVDAVYPGLGGVITTNTQFAAVLNSVLNTEGASVSASYNHYDPPGSNNLVHDPKRMTISTLQNHGNGSYVEIANLSSVGVGTGGLKESSAFGSRGSGMAIAFKEFIVHEDGDNLDGVEVSFSFSINGQPATSHSFDRTYVNNLFGKDSGKVETPEEMATLLHSLLDAQWPNLIIEAKSPTEVMLKLDPAADRKWGSGTSMSFDNVRVSIEPIPKIQFMDIDIAANPDKIASYINYIDIVTERAIDGMTTLGAFQKRIDMQSAFTSKLMTTIDKGIGRLIDADMNEASTRLKALQTQEQLGIQSLQIANANSENIMALFR
ncbi:flagellin [Pararhizobium sp. PWRC1-1]|uniref:flagellin N-terminal helical domain-containing protein n=1 Tax=Pararhizobium sp. PWRC1-1 TaxID=2804566 RepID=UPI003CF449FC